MLCRFRFRQRPGWTPTANWRRLVSAVSLVTYIMGVKQNLPFQQERFLKDARPWDAFKINRHLLLFSDTCSAVAVSDRASDPPRHFTQQSLRRPCCDVTWCICCQIKSRKWPTRFSSIRCMLNEMFLSEKNASYFIFSSFISWALKYWISISHTRTSVKWRKSRQKNLAEIWTSCRTLTG